MFSPGRMRAPLALALVGLAFACRGESGFNNEMAEGSTPYLALGRSEPVGWQGWSREAFKLAGRLDRPILLAVGAAGCSACTLMDRETYDDPLLAGLIDSLFVPVRVDADERPDVARRYGTAVYLLTGLEGYPLTVFLTPEGSAFFGGTYFPPDDPLTGRGIRQILPEVARSFHTQHALILRQAAVLHQLAYTRAEGARGVLGPELVANGIASVRGALAVALMERTGVRTVAAAQGTALLLEASRSPEPEADSSDLDVARGVLDVDVDSAASGTEGLSDLERAAAVDALVLGWQRTGDERYRDAARTELRTLVQQTGELGRVIFTDRAAYVTAVLLRAGASLGDIAALRIARGALDALLGRVYVPTRGARHATLGADTMPLLLDDQVQLAGACLAGARVTPAGRYRGIAQDLLAGLEHNFADPTGGYYDAATADPVTPAFGERTKQVLDGALPGANAAAAGVLLELAEETGEPAYRQRAEAALEAFAGLIPAAGLRAATYLRAAATVLPPH